MARISVILPVKARRDEDVVWLREAIDSVLAQTVEDWELFIINDDSQIPLKSVGDLVKKDKRISAVRSNGEGVAAARNTGLELASGSLLLPLDHDDILPPKAMEYLQLAWDNGGEDFGVVYGDVLSFGPDFQRHMDMPKFLFTTLLRTLIMPIGSLHSVASAKEIGGWDSSFQIGLEDWEYWIRMAVNGYHGFHVQTVTYHYRRHPHGRLAFLRQNDDKYQAAKEAIREKYIDYYNGKEPKMCKGCGSRMVSFRPKGMVNPAPPPPPAAFTAAVATAGRVLVTYIGSKGGSFGVTGKSTGWKYNVPGGFGCHVEGPDGRPGVHMDDAPFFRGYDGGRAFKVEP